MEPRLSLEDIKRINREHKEALARAEEMEASRRQKVTTSDIATKADALVADSHHLRMQVLSLIAQLEKERERADKAEARANLHETISRERFEGSLALSRQEQAWREALHRDLDAANATIATLLAR